MLVRAGFLRQTVSMLHELVTAGSIVLLCGLAMGVRSIRVLLRTFRLRAPACVRCGYAWDAYERCPECGGEAHIDERRRGRILRRHGGLVLAVMLLMSTAAVPVSVAAFPKDVPRWLLMRLVPLEDPTWIERDAYDVMVSHVQWAGLEMDERVVLTRRSLRLLDVLVWDASAFDERLVWVPPEAEGPRRAVAVRAPAINDGTLLLAEITPVDRAGAAMESPVWLNMGGAGNIRHSPYRAASFPAMCERARVRLHVTRFQVGFATAPELNRERPSNWLDRVEKHLVWDREYAIAATIDLPEWARPRKAPWLLWR